MYIYIYLYILRIYSVHTCEGFSVVCKLVAMGPAPLHSLPKRVAYCTENNQYGKSTDVLGVSFVLCRMSFTVKTTALTEAIPATTATTTIAIATAKTTTANCS